MRAPLSLALLATVSFAPRSLAHFNEHQMFVVDYAGNKVHYVRPNYSFRTILGHAEGLQQVSAIGASGDSNLLIADEGSNNIKEFFSSLNSWNAIESTKGIKGVRGPNAIVVDGYGMIYIANTTAREIIKVTPDFQYSWVFADASDGLTEPVAMAFQPDGTMLVADGASGDIFTIDPAGNTALWDNIPGQNVRSIVIRVNRDVYAASTPFGELYRYPAGVVSNRLLLGSYAGLEPSMAISPGGRKIVHVNRGNGRLREIDPDTGASGTKINLGWDAMSIVYIGGHKPAGSFSSVAFGTPGTGKFFPDLHGEGNPRPGGNIAIHLENFVGNSTGFLAYGFQGRQALFGGTWTVDLTQPFFLLPVQLYGRPGYPGEGDRFLVFTIPSDPSLALDEVMFQGLFLDPGNPNGATISPGLRMRIGD